MSVSQKDICSTNWNPETAKISPYCRFCFSSCSFKKDNPVERVSADHCREAKRWVDSGFGFLPSTPAMALRISYKTLPWSLSKFQGEIHLIYDIMMYANSWSHPAHVDWSPFFTSPISLVRNIPPKTRGQWHAEGSENRTFRNIRLKVQKFRW